MNCHIKKMVPKDIKLIEMIIKGNGEKSNKTAGVIRPKMLKVLYTSNDRISHYKTNIIEVKRRKEGVGINDLP